MLEYKEKYGDIFSFTLPSQYVVVVSTQGVSMLQYKEKYASVKQTFGPEIESLTLPTQYVVICFCEYA